MSKLCIIIVLRRKKMVTEKLMGARRDDIGVEERVQIALEVMARNRKQGRATELAKAYAVSRKTIYDIGNKGKTVLLAGMHPAGYGPQAEEKVIKVTRNRLVRGCAKLTSVGVSQRNVMGCLEELLDTERSLGWVNGEVAKLEEAAGKVNGAAHPSCGESLSGDEIYSNDQPNLLVVGNESLYIYELSRQPACDGDTWGCILLDMPEAPQFASDAGTGLGAGVEAAGIKVHQLDWDHLLRPMWGQVARMEQQAYAALDELEKRTAQFNQSHTEKRLQNHLRKWEKLSQDADEKIARLDAFNAIARQVDDCFALIDLQNGDIRDSDVAISLLQELADHLKNFSGRIYQKLSSNLKNWAPALFSYQPILSQAIQPLYTQYGKDAIAALNRIWQIDAEFKRRTLPLMQKQRLQSLRQEFLDRAHILLGEAFGDAWQQLDTLLSRSWRGSMLAECVNSLLRPILDKRQHTDQGSLDLFRFFHNHRIFQRGKRTGASPAQLAGCDSHNDPLMLLGLDTKC